ARRPHLGGLLGLHLAPEGPHVLGDEEARLEGPAQVPLRRLELRLPERRAVHRGLAGLPRGTVADRGADTDEGRLPRLRLRRLEGAVDPLVVPAVHGLDVPAVPLEAL